MARPAHNPSTWLGVCGLLTALAVSLFLNIGTQDLTQEEPRRALVALEMELSGNYIVPTLNGESYYVKPPLYNWVLAALFNITSSHGEWVVRLPSILSLLMVGALQYLLVAHYTSRPVGLLSSLFTVTSAHIYFNFSLLGEIDLFYTLVLYVQAVAIFYLFEKKRFWALFLVSYTLTAAGLLTKGLPSVALQGLTLLAWFSLNKRFWMLFSPQHIVGLALCVAIVSGYFYVYSFYEDPRPAISLLLSEAFSRTVLQTNTNSIPVGHFFRFPLQMALVLAPWVVYGVFLSSKQRWKMLAANPLTRFCLVFIGVNCLVYWLSPSTVLRYLFIFVPFATAVLAYGYHCFAADSPRRIHVLDLFWSTIFALLAIAFLVLPFYGPLAASPGIRLAGPIFFTLFGAVFWVYRSRCDLRPWLAVTAVVVLRIAFDVVGIPAKQIAQESKKPFKALVADLLAQSAGEPIVVETRRHPITVYIRLPLVGQIGGPIVGKWDELVPYQISYHYSDATGRVLRVDNSQTPGALYFADKDVVKDKGIQILREYEADGRLFVLYRYPS
jgi:4-amino-4-deoxy-L-arabinose transferase-like glycosyltransferase